MLKRTFTPADVAPMAALHARCFPEGEVWSATQIAGSLSLDTTLAFGWEDPDGGLVAFLLVQRSGPESEILTFCTDPAWRRQGIGRQLIQAALAKLDPEDQFLLDVAADNHEAIKLYESVGFTLFGRRPAYYPHGAARVDALAYRLLVKAPSSSTGA